jgi:hypothetical protein
MDPDAGLERAAVSPTPMLAGGWEVGRQCLELRKGPGPVDRFAPLR